MFKQRLLTACVLVPLVLLAIYLGNQWLLGFIVLLLVVMGGWEWTQLIPLNAVSSKIIFVMCLLLMVYLSAFNFIFYEWMLVGLALWIGILMAVLTFPTSQRFWGTPLWVGAACLILLPLFANTFAAIYHHKQGKNLVVYLLCLVWAADTGAYLAGKYCGRQKLIPQVSPGKTVEGFLGGFLLAMLVAVIGSFCLRPRFLGVWFGIAIITALISTLGDLFISMLKRRSKIKDTGGIFPGHGGVLDRLDSLIAAAPFMYCGLLFL